MGFGLGLCLAGQLNKKQPFLSTDTLGIHIFVLGTRGGERNSPLHTEGHPDNLHQGI